MMGELVLNEVEGKEFFTIKMVYFSSYPNIPVFQYTIIPIVSASFLSINSAN